VIVCRYRCDVFDLYSAETNLNQASLNVTVAGDGRLPDHLDFTQQYAANDGGHVLSSNNACLPPNLKFVVSSSYSTKQASDWIN
jgi:hypothetical protein